MDFRFWHSADSLSHLHLYLSSMDEDVAFGARGAKFTTEPIGKRPTLGIPGTSLFYTPKSSEKSRKRRPQDIQSQLNVESFFMQMSQLAEEEEQFVLGVQAMTNQDEPRALVHFEASANLPDAAFMAGLLSLKLGQTKEAITYLERVLEQVGILGLQFEKYDLQLSTDFPVTDDISVFVRANEIGTRFVLTEAYIRNGDLLLARNLAAFLHRIDPHDAILMLSYVELLYLTAIDDESALRKIIRITRDIPNNNDIHSSIRLYRARAQRVLDQHYEALDTLSRTLRKKRTRSAPVVTQLLYERATLHEQMNQMDKAAQDYQEIVRLAPGFNDARDRLLRVQSS